MTCRGAQYNIQCQSGQLFPSVGARALGSAVLYKLGHLGYNGLRQ
jgi:hypothetical protein